MAWETTFVTNVLVVVSALGAQPHQLHAQRARILLMDQLCVYHALQVNGNMNRDLCILCCLILGHMCPSPGLEPIECQTGFYSLGNSTSCLTCPAGYSCLSTANIPVPCSHGEYSLEGNYTCILCEAGYACGDSKSLPRSCDPGM